MPRWRGCSCATAAPTSSRGQVSTSSWSRRSAQPAARTSPSRWPPTSSGWARPTSSSASCSRPGSTSCRPPTPRRLTRLQDRVDPFPFEDVQAIVEEELGVSIGNAFNEFDAETARVGVARPGPPGHAAAAAARSSSRCSVPASARRCATTWRRWPSSRDFADKPHRRRPPLRLRPAARPVPPLAGRRARLPARGRQPAAAARAHPRLRPAHRARAGRRLHQQPGADHGLRRRAAR